MPQRVHCGCPHAAAGGEATQHDGVHLACGQPRGERGAGERTGAYCSAKTGSVAAEASGGGNSPSGLPAANAFSAGTFAANNGRLDTPALPLHNTRNTGYANAAEAVALGCGRSTRTPGSIGGRPFAPALTGNIATEDLAHAMRPLP